MADATRASEASAAPQGFRWRLIPAMFCWGLGVLLGLIAFAQFISIAFGYFKYGMSGGYVGMDPWNEMYPSGSKILQFMIAAVGAAIGIEAGNAWIRQQRSRAILLSVLFFVSWGSGMALQSVRNADRKAANARQM